MSNERSPRDVCSTTIGTSGIPDLPGSSALQGAPSLSSRSGGPPIAYGSGVTTAADLELPALEFQDPELRGPAFHEAMRELREENWVARVDPVGFLVLDREAATHFIRSKSCTFPGRKMLEVQGVTEGPL